MKSYPFFSIIIPVHNEQDAIALLHQEIVDVCTKMQKTYEIIIIDDGSVDNTFSVLNTLIPVRIIKFRKNFGQTAALDVGIKKSQGEYIITMDGDGQNDPYDIPVLFEALITQDKDVISGWRKNRKDSFLKRASSLMVARIRKSLINDGIHDSGCTLKIYKCECFDNIDLYGEMHRFIPALLKIKGFTIGEVIVNHRARTFGVTKYNWTRGIRGLLDIVSVWFWMKFANRPLHLFGTIGISLFIFSWCTLLIAVYQKIFLHVGFSDTGWTIVSVFSFLAGIQLTVSGLLADILSKTYFNATKDKSYIIHEELDR